LSNKKDIGRRFFKHNVSLIIGIVMLMGIIGVAVLAPYLAPYDPLKVNVDERMEFMSREHLLGTDGWGRDILSRIIFGGRYSLFIGIASISISMVFGTLVGLLGGYYSGSKFETIVLWVTDISMAFPTIIIAAIVAITLGPGIFNTVIALSVAFFPRFIRVARGTTLSVKEEMYILAAKSIGMSDLRLVFIHLIPNMISPVIVMAIIWAGNAITLEVALSFLGLGVPPPAPSWGGILHDNLRYFRMNPLGVIAPCVPIAWTVLALNLIGDRFRDLLDPRMR